MGSWSYRDSAGVTEVKRAFEALFGHPSTVTLTREWTAQYALSRPLLPTAGASLVAEAIAQVAEMEPVQEVHPNVVQQEALNALWATREQGNQAGLVVLATGMGKTYLAAFDSRAFGRVLFVAHREEILNQALATFSRVRPGAHCGFYRADQKDDEATVLFASVATLGRAKYLQRSARDAFDSMRRRRVPPRHRTELPQDHRLLPAALSARPHGDARAHRRWGPVGPLPAKPRLPL